MPRIDEETRQQRLERISLLLMRNARGLTEGEIAYEIRMERRSVNNYLRDLELQGKAFKDGLYWFPFALKETRLRSFDLSPEEAVTLYLGARLLSKQQDKRNEPAETALLKLASVLKADAGVGVEIEQAARELAQRPAQKDYQPIFRDAVRGYIYRKQVEIVYHPLHGKSFPTTFSTYLLEPSPIGFTTYLIGHSSLPNALRAYKLERIESIRLTRESYSVPPDFRGLEILRNAWSIVMGETTIRVILRFSPRVRDRVLETRWHPSQQTREDTEKAGCLLWEVQVADTLDLLPWIRSWGADCEVLEPEGLKNNMKLEVQRLAQRYGMKDNPLANSSHSIQDRILLLWGKTQKGSLDPNEYHPVLFHMLDVAFVARALLGNDASPRWRKSLGNVLGLDPVSLHDWLPWLVALHDIGKISVPFQEQNDLQKSRLIANGFDLGNRRWKNNPPHGLISQVFVKHEAEFPFPEKLLSGLADLAGGHHGWFSDAQTQIDARAALRKEPEEWKELRREATKLLFEVLNTKLPPNIDDVNVSAAGMMLTGFCILCDWLGSDRATFKITPRKSLAEYIPESMERAKSIVESAGFFRKSRSDTGNKFQDLFSDITPRPLQVAIDEIPASVLSSPCLAVIEAPTGEGKTEASLALAHRIAQFNETDEFYYALPTTATSNQMFGRLQDYLLQRLNLPTQINLIHGQAFLYQDDLRIQPLSNGNQDEDDAIDWFAPKKRALLAPFGVGTVDQAELAALNVKHVPLRLIGLAGKVLIIDEVHAYDTYMTTVIEMLLQWLGKVGTSVILLSATLPKERRARLTKAYGVQVTEEMRQDDSYPSLWIVSQADVHYSSPAVQQPDRSIFLDTSLNYGDDQLKEKAHWLLNAISGGGCACWMTNTVARAQQIFDAVDKAAPNTTERFLLHAQLPLDERQKREKEITEKFGPLSKDRKPSIVIGTQVLEQSLDLDFDVMVSDIAPIDLLLQRAGRLHRHIGRERPGAHAEPRFYVNAERDEKGELSLGVNRYVYAPYILHRTWEALQNRSEINLPMEYRPLIEFVYDEKEPDMDHPLRNAWDKLQKEQNTAVEQALLRIVPAPHPNDSFSGPVSQLRFKESETQASWAIAKTRLGEESITIIPLERKGDVYQATVDGEDIEFSLKQKISHDLQVQLLRRSIRVSNQRGVWALKSKMVELSSVFKDASLLKEAIPLFLTDNKTSFPFEKGIITFLLDPKLGLVIDFKKGV